MSHPSEELICLFGGTFDPIHLGHTHIAAAAVNVLGLDQVIFLPCKQSPHKKGQPHAADEHRLKMCQLATEQHAWATVDAFDLSAPEPSYSWRTAEHMAQKHPTARLFWLMGTDQWDALPSWSKPERLAELVEFIVFSRGEQPAHRSGYRMHAIHGNHPASATEIRHNYSKTEQQQWLDSKVATYMHDHLLYTH